MQYIVTPQRASETDRNMIDRYFIPSLLLMEQAATALANEAAALADGGKILVVCGKGNNGGDGWAAARILISRGFLVYCAGTSLELEGDALINRSIAERMCECELLTEDTDFFERHADAAVIIDALFGTGLTRFPSGLYAEIIDKINAHGARVVSADIPSGVFGATGQAQTAVRADVTVTFQYAKSGHFLYPGRELTGRLVTARIGVDKGFEPRDLMYIDRLDIEKRSSNTNKGTYGTLGLIAGSRGMAGAAVLCARAAASSGAGLVRAGSVEYVTSILQSAVPEVTVRELGTEAIEAEPLLELVKGCSALAAGPGMGVSDSTVNVIRLINTLSVKKVLDADALNVMAEDKSLLSGIKNAILTPHPKEFSRLSGINIGILLADPIKAAREYALMYGVVVLLKGATTVVTDGERTALVTAGSPSMAKGGSGDVLTGVIGGLLAQGMELFEAAYTGAYLCGKAGERACERCGEHSALPSDTIRELNF